MVCGNGLESEEAGKYKALKFIYGSSGWSGPLIVSPDEKRKKILTVNLTPVGKSGPLAKFITEELYVSDVKETNLILFLNQNI